MFDSESDKLLIKKKANDLLFYVQQVPIAIKLIDVVIIPTVGSDFDIKWWELVKEELKTRI
jgi:hypothetical protein